MPINVVIEDAELAGFGDPAKATMEKAGVEFLRDVIAEANRLESGQNSGGGPAEVTHVMVSDAILIQRRAIGTRKSTKTTKILRVSAAVLSLIVGGMYDTQQLTNTTYMAAFIVMLALAIAAIILSTIRD